MTKAAGYQRSPTVHQAGRSPIWQFYNSVITKKKPNRVNRHVKATVTNTSRTKKQTDWLTPTGQVTSRQKTHN